MWRDNESDGACVVRYYAAHTVVSIDGVVTERTRDANVTKTDRAWASEVTLGVEADRGCPFALHLEQKVIDDRKFDIRLTDDQRLTGADVEVTGIGLEAIAGAMSVASLVSGFLGGGGSDSKGKDGRPAGAARPRPSSVEAALRRTNRALYEARVAIRERIGTLRTAVIAEATKSAPNVERLKALDEALTAAQNEAVALELAFLEWRERMYPTWRRSLSYAIATDDLPRLDSPDRDITRDDPAGGQDWQAVAGELGVIVARIHKPHAVDEVAPADPDTSIHYRLPRSARLAVYKAVAPPTGDEPFDGEFRLCTLLRVLTVDSFCEWAHIPVPSPIFSKQGVTAEFGPQGTLVRIANAQAGPLTALVAKSAGADAASAPDGAAAAPPAKAEAPSSSPDVKALQDRVARDELEVRMLKARTALAKEAVQVAGASLASGPGPVPSGAGKSRRLRSPARRPATAGPRS